jgi:hypothetical protein
MNLGDARLTKFENRGKHNERFYWELADPVRNIPRHLPIAECVDAANDQARRSRPSCGSLQLPEFISEAFTVRPEEAEAT